jgi:hypothetical protein
MAVTNRVHYFHADASALGGYLERPIEQIIPLQAPLSLSPAGGYGSARGENFRLEGALSYKSASTQVSGGLSKKEGQGWVTLVTSVVEGLNVLDVITADRISAQISTEHPLVGDNPKVTFLGTSFENLKVAGYPIDVTLDLDICDQGSGSNYPSRPCVSDDRFLARVAEQYRRMDDEKIQPEWVKDRSVPNWLRERYALGSAQAGKKSSVLCSVVKETNGKFPGRPFGNVFEVPEFGRVFLGELLVDCQSYQLTMVRLELGCLAHGQVACAVSKSNGVTYPPGGVSVTTP